MIAQMTAQMTAQRAVEVLLSQGWTMDRIANAAGVSWRTLYRYRQGTEPKSVCVSRRLAQLVEMCHGITV